jgi:hypothetical protein
LKYLKPTEKSYFSSMLKNPNEPTIIINLRAPCVLAPLFPKKPPLIGIEGKK